MPASKSSDICHGRFIYHPTGVSAVITNILSVSPPQTWEQNKGSELKPRQRFFFFFFFNIPGVPQRSNWTFNTVWQLWLSNCQFKHAVSLLPNTWSRCPGVSEDQRPLTVTVKLLIVALPPPVRLAFFSLPVFPSWDSYLWFQGGFFFLHLWFSLF